MILADFDSTEKLVDNLFLVKKDGLYGLHNGKKLILSCEYKAISQPKWLPEHCVVVKNNEEKCGVYNASTSKFDVPCVYDGIVEYDCSDRVYIVMKKVIVDKERVKRYLFHKVGNSQPIDLDQEFSSVQKIQGSDGDQGLYLVEFPSTFQTSGRYKDTHPHWFDFSYLLSLQHKTITILNNQPDYYTYRCGSCNDHPDAKKSIDSLVSQMRKRYEKIGFSFINMGNLMDFEEYYFCAFSVRPEGISFVFSHSETRIPARIIEVRFKDGRVSPVHFFGTLGQRVDICNKTIQISHACYRE